MKCSLCFNAFGLFRPEGECLKCKRFVCKKCSGLKLPGGSEVCKECFAAQSNTPTGPNIPQPNYVLRDPRLHISLGGGLGSPQLPAVSDPDVPQPNYVRRNPQLGALPQPAPGAESALPLPSVPVDPIERVARGALEPSPPENRIPDAELAARIKGLSGAPANLSDDLLEARFRAITGRPAVTSTAPIIGHGGGDDDGDDDDDWSAAFDSTSATGGTSYLQDVRGLLSQMATASLDPADSQVEQLLDQMTRGFVSGSGDETKLWHAADDSEAGSIIQSAMLEADLERRMRADGISVPLARDDGLEALPSVSRSNDESNDRFCCICTEDAVCQCADCDDDLYCKRCSQETHQLPDFRSHKPRKL